MIGDRVRTPLRKERKLNADAISRRMRLARAVVRACSALLWRMLNSK